MLFKIMDRGGKGHVDINDVKRLMDIFEKDSSYQFADDVLSQADCNHDGKLEFNDFWRSYKQVPKKTRDEIEAIKRAFKFVAGGDQERVTRQ